ncbi:hypothetical protein FISHEDRAFT_35902, partial [Fistulina hepatica ATCC 64428]
LDSVTRSPLYSIYGETIAGVAIIRSFGASSKFLRGMLHYVDTKLGASMQSSTHCSHNRSTYCNIVLNTRSNNKCPKFPLPPQRGSLTPVHLVCNSTCCCRARR